MESSEHWSQSDGSTDKDDAFWVDEGGGGGDGERWEDAVEGDDESEMDGSDDDEDHVSEERAAELLLEFLLSLLLSGSTVTARTVCVILWWAWKAGLGHDGVKRFAYRPSAQSGKYQAHIDRAMGVSTKTGSYYIDLPLYLKGALTRSEVRTLMEIPSEYFLNEIADHPTFESDLQEVVSQGRLPRSYYDHEADCIAELRV